MFFGFKKNQKAMGFSDFHFLALALPIQTSTYSYS